MSMLASFVFNTQYLKTGAQSIQQTYQEPASKLIGAALTSNDGYEKLTWLCDRIGARISGSPQLDEAIRWSAEQMRKAGLENVRTPEVMVPRWADGSCPARSFYAGLGE